MKSRVMWLMMLAVLTTGCEQVKNANVAEKEWSNESQSSKKLTQAVEHGSTDVNERQKAERAALEGAGLLLNDGAREDWMAASDDERFVACILGSAHAFSDLPSEEHGRMAKRLENIVNDVYRDVPNSGDRVREILALALVFYREAWREEIKSGQKD